MLTHSHADHAGAAAEIRAWGDAEVVASILDAPVITGEHPPIPPLLTAAERQLSPGIGGTLVGPPCRVDVPVRGGEVLPFAGGARTILAPGHTPGSIGVYLPVVDAIVNGDAAMYVCGSVILGIFNTDRHQAKKSLKTLAATRARVACFGRGDPATEGASTRLALAIDPLGPGHLRTA